MADFLSNLVAKNLNLAPVLQPRPRSLYETSPVLRVGGIHARDVEALEVDVDHEAARLQTRPHVRGPIESNRTEPTLASLRPQPAILWRAEARTPAVEIKSLVAPGPAPPEAEPRAVGDSAPPHEPEIRTSVLPSASRVEHTHSTETLRTERVVVEKERPDASSHLALPEPTRFTLEKKTKRPGEIVPHIRDTRSTAHSATPLPTLLPQPVPSLIRTEGAPALPATINVTIGRIEVRAVTNRPAQKAMRDPQPSTLEDYLRRSSSR